MVGKSHRLDGTFSMSARYVCPRSCHSRLACSEGHSGCALHVVALLLRKVLMHSACKLCHCFDANHECCWLLGRAAMLQASASLFASCCFLMFTATMPVLAGCAIASVPIMNCCWLHWEGTCQAGLSCYKPVPASLHMSLS